MWQMSVFLTLTLLPNLCVFLKHRECPMITQIFASLLAAAAIITSSIIYVHFGAVHMNAGNLPIIIMLVGAVAGCASILVGLVVHSAPRRFFGTLSGVRAVFESSFIVLLSASVGFIIAEWMHTNVGYRNDVVPWTIFLSTTIIGMVTYLGIAFLRRDTILGDM